MNGYLIDYLSDLIPDKCPYCNKEFVHYDIHLRICEKYNNKQVSDDE